MSMYLTIKKHQKKISSSISKDNIGTGKRKVCDRDSILLSDVVPYSKALIDLIETPEWKKAIDTEYHSLTSHGTGDLVPYPTKPKKVVGGCGNSPVRKRNMVACIDTNLDGWCWEIIRNTCYITITHGPQLEEMKNSRLCFH
ncbi:hypothetical protein O181_131799 [Austropuccinia psidii MF-1]|uniref:Uncharacterized protein n=1 Tax=Austropuccinia psidii MF-1 TaxID=1389203 RepID=A0A9Q3QBG0_9BASI|nr:hypothetical protein [Austropuccinia psidii MF-1]